MTKINYDNIMKVNLNTNRLYFHNPYTVIDVITAPEKLNPLLSGAFLEHKKLRSAQAGA